MKNPIEVQLPIRNLIFVLLRAEKARNNALFAKFDNVRLDLPDSTAIEGTIRTSGAVDISAG